MNNNNNLHNVKKRGCKIKQKIIDLFTSKYIKNIAITFHFSPDGDAIGSAVALSLALESIGKHVDIITKAYSAIFTPILKNVNIVKTVKKKYDLCILVDCSSRERTINLDAISKLLIVIDHHINCTPIGQYYYCKDKPAAVMIIFEFLMQMNINITPEIATALYLGLYTDTSGFTNSNMSVEVFHQAAILMTKGADLATINQICKTKTLSMFKVLSEVFTRIIYDNEYRIVYLVLMKEDLDKYNVSYDIVEYLMEELKHIKDTEVSFLFIESFNNTKVKARSNGNVLINKIMEKFGGNGFPKAAGTVIESTNIYYIVDNIISSTKQYIDLLLPEIKQHQQNKTF